MQIISVIMIALLLALPNNLFSKSKTKEEPAKESKLNSSVLSGMKFRSIGPGLTSGRIIDFAVNPKDRSEYYVAVACGGVWKTTNGGQSFNPIFDGQKPFSIGCITIDNANPYVLWVGTGENNSQRSVAWGDGVYKSEDGGKSWKNMGLKKSEHIGKILIDPRNSNVVWVAAQGPLWGPGGDRGLYKTTDGGATWKCVLSISENTGVTDIVMDPRNPDLVIAATYQRRRHVFSVIDGGPEGGLQKTTDGGASWTKLASGLPGGDIGRIGLAISPINPDIVYAITEAEEGSGGFYRSPDRGASWEKRSSHYAGSAQYYQELVCDPKQLDKVYSLETVLQVTEDGGRTFRGLGNNHRHVDDHAIWIDPNNTNYLIVGGDGGVYETYDCGKNWRHIDNLPVTQFYRVSVDNSEPFYYVYGGTQDNNSWGGPTRTNNSGGITNDEWFCVVGGDGYEPQIDPKDPNLVYCQWQYGNIMRFDRKTGEAMYIQPQGEVAEEHRWNWDTPLLISPHSNTRLYIACNRLYRSDDRGNNWTAVSPDITRQIDRNSLPIMGKIWSPEAVAKSASTSLYGNTISISESPVKENLIYLGTDDGLIQVSEDCKNWRKIDKFPTVPETTYVTDVLASQHSEGVVYATFNNHKNNDFKPYVLKSSDKGASWVSISSNLPEDQPVWCIAEDHANPNLLFVGTEFGVYFTVDGGNKWIQLKSGLPSIAVRDIDIQKRENDLVLGTFGRGIYILDDYSALRTLNEDMLEKDVYVFDIKDGLMFMPDDSKAKHDLGETFYRGKNPEIATTITYYLKEGFKTKKDIRKEAEKDAEKDNKNLAYPSKDALRAEDLEESPFLIFTITDESGRVIRNINQSPSAGINRINWDMCYAGATPVSKSTKTDKFSGFPVVPGNYFVSVSKCIDGVVSEIAGPKAFKTKLLERQTLPAKDKQALHAYHEKIAKLEAVLQATNQTLRETNDKVDLLKVAIYNTPFAKKDLIEKARKLEYAVADLDRQLNGDNSLAKRNENQPSSMLERLNSTLWMSSTFSDPSGSAMENYKILSAQLTKVLAGLKTLIDTDIRGIENELDKAKAPWTPGRFPEWQE